MDEQGRASRDITRAAQVTATSAAQVRLAMSEQATAAGQIKAAVESLRRGAASPARSRA